MAGRRRVPRGVAGYAAALIIVSHGNQRVRWSAGISDGGTRRVESSRMAGMRTRRPAWVSPPAAVVSLRGPLPADSGGAVERPGGIAVAALSAPRAKCTSNGSGSDNSAAGSVKNY